MAFPYGILADRIGRKPTAFMAYGSVAVSFGFAPFMLNVMKKAVRENPYLLMTGSLFLLFGGGVPVLLNTLYAMAADVSSEKEKYVICGHFASFHDILTGAERRASSTSLSERPLAAWLDLFSLAY